MLYNDDIRDYCIRKPGTTEEEPFGPGTVTFKVCGKIYLFLPLDAPAPAISVKGDPERLAELREQYEEVTTGAYLNPKHWVRVLLHGRLPDKLVLELVDRSYELVVQGLTKAQRATLA